MVTIAEAYKRVNDEWPAELPPLTGWEAVRAAARLWRFATGSTCPYEIRETSGNRYTWVRGRTLLVNPTKGWHDFIHDLSHYLVRYVAECKPHSRDHARFERRLVREVVKRGWLDGRLKEKETVEPVAAPVDDRLAKLRHIEALAKKWDAKKRRAETALKKLARRARYYERAARAATGNALSDSPRP